MECSKCNVAKGPDSFYAKGRVCKDCKRDYARKYRSSKGSDMQSHATTDAASIRSVEDLVYIVDEDVRNHLHTLEAQLDDSKDNVVAEITFLKIEMRQAVSSLAERLCTIEALLEALCNNKVSNERNAVPRPECPSHARIASYPLADLL